MTTTSLRASRGFARPGLITAGILALAVVGALVWFFVVKSEGKKEAPAARAAPAARTAFTPTPEQWAAFTVEPVRERLFRPGQLTEGKIAVDEDRSTPIFSPYAGRVTKLLAKPGHTVARGQPLFVVEATDMVQAQNDFFTALAALNKSRSQRNLTQTVEKRLAGLYQDKAIALKDWQQSQADLTAAQNDERSAEAALEAVRNRLRILGKSEDEISGLQNAGRISSETTIPAPIAGTIVQRKVGPGQYVGSGSTDPVFVIGDLSAVWLVAYMREADTPSVKVGQQANFSVLAFPERTFEATVAYVATALDPSTRRLLVRATVQNPEGLLRPEMFASVRILTGSGENSPAIPRDAIIYEGSTARVWVARDDKSVETRQIKLGLIRGDVVQVTEGLSVGDKIVTRGSLFIDRIAGGS